MSELPPTQPPPLGSPQPNWPPTTAQPAAQPVAPAKSGMSATKIILIVVGVIVVLGILVVGVLGLAGWYIVKSVHRDANGQASLNLPFVSVQSVPSDKITEKDLGIPIYPGARPEKFGSLSKTDSFTILSAHFRTSDPGDKVIAFYKDKAGPDAQVIALPFGTGTQIQAQLEAGVSIKILITELTNTTGSGTRIQIDRSTQVESPK